MLAGTRMRTMQRMIYNIGRLWWLWWQGRGRWRRRCWWQSWHGWGWGKMHWGGNVSYWVPRVGEVGGAQGGEQPHARQKTTTFSPQKNNPLAKKNNIKYIWEKNSFTRGNQVRSMEVKELPQATVIEHNFSRNFAKEICFCEGVGPIAMICHFAWTNFLDVLKNIC